MVSKSMGVLEMINIAFKQTYKVANSLKTKVNTGIHRVWDVECEDILTYIGVPRLG